MFRISYFDNSRKRVCEHELFCLFWWVGSDGVKKHKKINRRYLSQLLTKLIISTTHPDQNQENCISGGWVILESKKWIFVSLYNIVLSDTDHGAKWYIIKKTCRKMLVIKTEKTFNIKLKINQVSIRQYKKEPILVRCSA